MNELLPCRSGLVARRAAIAFVAVVALAGALKAADELTATPPGAADPGERLADLTIHLPIAVGDYEFTRFYAAIPGFALVGARLDPDSSRTRLMVGIRFTSRSVRKARLQIALLDSYKDSAQRIHQVSHIEALGPEQVTTKGRNLDLWRNWQAERALWFNFPIEARQAKAFRVEVLLERNDDSEEQRSARANPNSRHLLSTHPGGSSIPPGQVRGTDG